MVRRLPDDVLQAYPNVYRWALLVHNILAGKKAEETKRKEWNQLDEPLVASRQIKRMDDKKLGEGWDQYRKHTIKAWKYNENEYIKQNQKLGIESFPLLNALIRIQNIERKLNVMGKHKEKKGITRFIEKNVRDTVDNGIDGASSVALNEKSPDDSQANKSENSSIKNNASRIIYSASDEEKYFADISQNNEHKRKLYPSKRFRLSGIIRFGSNSSSKKSSGISKRLKKTSRNNQAATEKPLENEVDDSKKKESTNPQVYSDLFVRLTEQEQELSNLPKQKNVVSCPDEAKQALALQAFGENEAKINNENSGTPTKVNNHDIDDANRRRENLEESGIEIDCKMPGTRCMDKVLETGQSGL